MNFLYLIRQNIPNGLTCLNLLFGVFSIIATFEGYPVWASVFIFVAVFFDFIDGLTARLLNARSEIGKQLDSLADLISFGLAPAVIVYSFLKSVLLISHIEPDDFSVINLFILSAPFLITVFSALRLAKFNIDSRQELEFIGLPTPANAIFFAWLPIILNQFDLRMFFLIFNLKTLITVTILHSFFLISPFPLFSFKIKSFLWKGNEFRYVFILVSIILVILFNIYSVLLIIWLYLLIGIFRYLWGKIKK